MIGSSRRRAEVRGSHIVLDFTQRTKSSYRLRHELASALAMMLSPHFDRVTLLYPNADPIDNVSGAVEVIGLKADSDVWCEEVGLPILLKRLRATDLFTFREGMVLPPGVSGHLYLPEDPAFRRSLEQRGSSTMKAKALGWRSKHRFLRLLARARSLTTPSRWTLEQLRRGPTASFRAVRSAAVVPEGGFSDAVASRSPTPYEQRSHVLIGTSPDPRDDVTWALRVYELATADLANAPGATVIGVARIPEERIRGSVEYLGFVSEVRLLELHATALAFLHPSSFEGFGLPIVEAMQCGTPVFAPSGSAVDEVAGDGAFSSVEAAARSLRRNLESRDAWVKESLGAWRRGNEYRWSKCARDLTARTLIS